MSRCSSLVVALCLAVATAFAPSASKPIASSHRTAGATMKEAAAKAKWLASIMKEMTRANGFGDMTPTEDTVPTTAKVATPANQDVAKAKWLSKLDQPKFGVMSEAAAKAVWLRKIEEQQQARKLDNGDGKVVPTAAAPQEEAAAMVDLEAAAKAAWLNRIEKK